MLLASALMHGWKKQSLLGERSVEYEVYSNTQKMLFWEKPASILNNRKATHRKNKPSNKTEAFTKSMNMYIGH